MKYAYYTEEELILDETFQNWVRQTNAVDIAFWNEWINAHPQYSSKIENARHMLLNLDFSEKPVPEADVSHAWAELQEAIKRKKNPSNTVGNSKISIRRKTLNSGWYKVAAILTIIIMSGALYWLNRNKLNTHATKFGETAVITLPDGSQVTLNGNTSLRYFTNWSQYATREVWLDGEAFFAVNKKAQANTGSAKFIVHIPDMDVEVMGTKFNVYHRKQMRRVVLNSGQVKISVNHTSKAGSLLMLPGELVELSGQNKQLIRKKVNPDIYSSWKYNKLVFDNTSLAEIAEMIETTYGAKFIFQDTIQAGRKLSGTIPTDNLDILIMTLSKSFNISITKDADQFLVRANDIPVKPNVLKK